MDWRLGSAIEDLVVPKDEGVSDCLSSPDGWTLWSKNVENLNSPKKFTTEGVEECLFGWTTFHSEVEQLSAPNVYRGYGHSFCRQSAYPDGYSDFQVNDFSRFNEADDIFLHSLFKSDGSEVYGADISADTAQTSSQNDGVSVVNLLAEGDHVRDCTYDVSDDYPFPEAKDTEFEIFVSADPLNMCENINEEEICLEESVLLELRRSMLQLAENTRSCFRDSLYRLAENSRQQVSCSQDTVEAPEVCMPATGALSRSGETNTKVSKTNAIDRTVATLLFNTMKSPYQPNSSVSSLSSGDAEVPTIRSIYQPMQR